VKNTHEQSNVVSSDAGMVKEERSDLIINREKPPVRQEKPVEEKWELYTIHFPNGKQISKTRVLSTPEGKWVIAVTDLVKKEGLAIAKCRFEWRKYGDVFYTRYHHEGHTDLCNWMKQRGIGGYYKEYLDALDKGCDEEVLEELGNDAEISFVIEETDMTPDDWTIYRIEEEGGKEKLVIL
jgi:hypothetical protein